MQVVLKTAGKRGLIPWGHCSHQVADSCAHLEGPMCLPIGRSWKQIGHGKKPESTIFEICTSMIPCCQLVIDSFFASFGFNFAKSVPKHGSGAKGMGMVGSRAFLTHIL